MRDKDEIRSEYRKCLEMTARLTKRHKHPVQFARGFTTALGYAAGLHFEQSLNDVDEMIDTGECSHLNGNGGFQYTQSINGTGSGATISNYRYERATQGTLFFKG